MGRIVHGSFRRRIGFWDHRDRSGLPELPDVRSQRPVGERYMRWKRAGGHYRLLGRCDEAVGADGRPSVGHMRDNVGNPPGDAPRPWISQALGDHRCVRDDHGYGAQGEPVKDPALRPRASTP